MDDQLQDAGASASVVTGFRDADALQHQVLHGVAVPARHKTQDLQTRTQDDPRDAQCS